MVADGEVRWEGLRRDQIAAMPPGTVILQPIGSVEQHGPHLPIDTDTVSATEVALRAARQLTDPPALVLPPIWWGLSPYWLPFAGTLTLRPETILSLFADLGASVAAHGFRRLVIVNGHGGNAGIVGVAATQLAEHGVRAAALSYWSLLGDELRRITPGDGGHIGHAGQTETSIQLALRPDLVDHAAVRPEHCADLTGHADAPFAGAYYAPPDPLRESPHGVYGDAPAATAAAGEEVLALAAARLAAFVRGFAGEG